MVAKGVVPLVGVVLLVLVALASVEREPTTPRGGVIGWPVSSAGFPLPHPLHRGFRRRDGHYPEL